MHSHLHGCSCLRTSTHCLPRCSARQQNSERVVQRNFPDALTLVSDQVSAPLTKLFPLTVSSHAAYLPIDCHHSMARGILAVRDIQLYGNEPSNDYRDWGTLLLIHQTATSRREQHEYLIHPFCLLCGAALWELCRITHPSKFSCLGIFTLAGLGQQEGLSWSPPCTDCSWAALAPHRPHRLHMPVMPAMCMLAGVSRCRSRCRLSSCTGAAECRRLPAR